MSDSLKISRKSVTEQIVEYLKENIENGVWEVGTKIDSEAQLTKTLGVSRASVRAAIRELVGIGVLKSEQGMGTYVETNNVNPFVANKNTITEEDCKDILKVLEFRSILEPKSAYFAALRSTEENIVKLESCLNHMKENVGNPKEYIKADMLFHEELSISTRNNLIIKSLHGVFMQTLKTHIRMNTIFGYDGIHYHELILDAVKNKDSARSEKEMEKHLLRAIKNMEQRQGK